jgi:hypothetical protein
MDIVTRRGFSGVIVDGEWQPLSIQGGQIGFDPSLTDEQNDANLQRYEDFSRRSQQRFRESPEGQAWLETIGNSAGFQDKQLDQAWKIAELNESGANSRASISAGASKAASAASAAASRYSADASKANARVAAEASKYGADTSRYGMDLSRLTDQEKIALDRELGRAGLGVDLVKTAATLTGPENVFSYVDLLRGGRMMGGVPYFLGGLTGQSPMASFGAPSGTPTPMTMDSILKGLGAGGGGGTMSDGSGGGDLERDANAFKSNLSGLLSGGAHRFEQGSLERMNPSELGLLQGAAGKLGYRWEDISRQYLAAKPGQGSASAA